MTVNSGDMRYLYMHLQNAFQNLAGTQVRAGQQIGEMGCSGMTSCAPHLHLGAMMRGSALQAYGAGGRFWREGSGKSLENQPLTAEMIKKDMPDGWYLVNPETFLDHQIPFDSGDGKPAVYGPQMGGWRSVTLPRTCSPDQTVIEDPRIASTTGTGAAGNAIDTQASSRSGNEGFAANQAGQDKHGLFVEFAKLAASDLAGNTLLSEIRNRAATDVALAHLVIRYAEGGRAP